MAYTQAEEAKEKRGPAERASAPHAIDLLAVARGESHHFLLALNHGLGERGRGLGHLRRVLEVGPVLVEVDGAGLGVVGAVTRVRVRVLLVVVARLEAVDAAAAAARVRARLVLVVAVRAAHAQVLARRRGEQRLLLPARRELRYLFLLQLLREERVRLQHPRRLAPRRIDCEHLLEQREEGVVGNVLEERHRSRDLVGLGRDRGSERARGGGEEVCVQAVALHARAAQHVVRDLGAQHALEHVQLRDLKVELEELAARKDLKQAAPERPDVRRR
eukprot:1532019-Rhodomonas_salina.7